MKISKIQKKNNKYKIILEDNNIIETYDEILIKENILYKIHTPAIEKMTSFHHFLFVHLS